MSRSPILLVVLVMAPVAVVRAAPIVSLDVDPSTPGVQSAGSVLPGTGFDVDVVISGVDAGAPLNGFEFDLDFDPAVVTAISVVDGGFLLSPVFTVQQVVGALSVEFAEVTLLPAGATGSGTLATIHFEAIGVGTSPLDLNDLILAAPFGVPIPPGAVNDGSVTSAASTPIPEPAGAILYVAGAALVARRARRRDG